MTSTSNRFLALLRGINVGGKNVIAKDDLKACFEDLGLENVRTYIQSGNILFRSDETRVKELTASIEAGLSERFSYEAQAVVLSHKKYKSSVAAAPAEWGHDDSRKHNAMFTLSSTTPKKVLARLTPPKSDIESVATAPGVIFWSASIAELSKTTVMKLASLPVYQQMTVRNHNTVFKLLDLFETI
ncbi:MAG: DUF1697 domain-containing protein [Pirellulaceae bacterium]|jgi:uncharacterized protein (DUF1697 family)|nr:DUF1697 domain-containing protein [Pirellulaceae bacterium]MDP7020631.1 DUF1697 domain-containing protein [Pirellulaceae bacterium]